jgi:hypothetical protein
VQGRVWKVWIGHELESIKGSTEMKKDKCLVTDNLEAWVSYDSDEQACGK